MPVNFTKNISMSIQSQAKSARNPLFEAGLLIIVCVLFVWFLILPKQAETDQKSGDLAKVQAQQGQTKGQLTKLQSLIKSLPSNSQNITMLDQALPLDGNTVRLQLLIQSLAQSVGVTVGNINISGNPKGVVAGDKTLLANPFGVTRTVQTLDGSIYLIGSFNQLQALLEKFESSGRLIDVDSLAINQGSAGNLNMTVTFKTYYLAP